MTVFHYPGNLRIGIRRETVYKTSPSRRIVSDGKLLLMVLLEGHQRFILRDKTYEFSSLDAHDPQPKAVFLKLAEGDCVEYLESIGAPLVKLSVALDKDWLEHAGSLMEDTFDPVMRVTEVARLPDCMMHRVWAMSTDMVDIARDIVRINETFNAGLQSRNAMNLALMARGIDLVRAALHNLGTLRQRAESDQERLGLDPRLQRLSAYILGHLDEPNLGPEELARACGVGLRSLQRLCRTALNCSPSDFIRTQRMDAAFAALSTGRITVQQASHCAGYTSAANFSTAFKRMFGLSPSQVSKQKSV